MRYAPDKQSQTMFVQMIFVTVNKAVFFYTTELIALLKSKKDSKQLMKKCVLH